MSVPIGQKRVGTLCALPMKSPWLKFRRVKASKMYIKMWNLVTFCMLLSCLSPLPHCCPWSSVEHVPGWILSVDFFPLTTNGTVVKKWSFVSLRKSWLTSRYWQSARMRSHPFDFPKSCNEQLRSTYNVSDGVRKQLGRLEAVKLQQHIRASSVCYAATLQEVKKVQKLNGHTDLEENPSAENQQNTHDRQTSQSPRDEIESESMILLEWPMVCRQVAAFARTSSTAQYIMQNYLPMGQSKVIHQPLCFEFWDLHPYSRSNLLELDSLSLEVCPKGECEWGVGERRDHWKCPYSSEGSTHWEQRIRLYIWCIFLYLYGAKALSSSFQAISAGFLKFSVH